MHAHPDLRQTASGRRGLTMPGAAQFNATSKKLQSKRGSVWSQGCIGYTLFNLYQTPNDSTYP